MVIESHAVGWSGVPRRCGASLGFAASGVSRAWACILPRSGGAGGGPIRAPSQNLPLPLVTAASLLCLAQVQPPHTHPHSGQQPRPPNLPGLSDSRGGEEGLSRPQFPHMETGRIGLCLRALTLQDHGTSEGLLGSTLRLPVFPPFHPMQGTECSTPMSPGLCTHGEVAPSLSLRSSSIQWGDACSDGTSLPISQTGHRQVSESGFRTVTSPPAGASPTSSPLVLSLFFPWRFRCSWAFLQLEAPPGPSLREAPQAPACPCCVPGRPAEGQDCLRWCRCRQSC